MSIPVDYDFFDEEYPLLREQMEDLPPPIPETYRGPHTGYRYTVQNPQPNPNYVWVGNRDTFSGNWHKIGDPITPEAVGPTTYGYISDDQVFGPQHHNIASAAESGLSQEQLQEKLRNLNIPAEGERSELFKRLINVKESPELVRRLASGGRPTELDLADEIYRHQPTTLEQAAHLRNLRGNVAAPGLEAAAQPSRSLFSRLNPYNWRSQSNPISAGGVPISNVEATGARQWGAQNLANRAAAIESASRLGTGARPMGLSNIPGGQANALAGAGAGAAAAGSSGMFGSAAGFASRALPIINLVMLAGMLAKQMGKNKEEQKQRAMRT